MTGDRRGRIGRAQAARELQSGTMRLIAKPSRKAVERRVAEVAPAIPEEERGNPAAQVMLVAFAEASITAEAIARRLARDGVVGEDGKPHPLLRAQVSVNASLAGLARALKMTPSRDARDIHAAARREAEARGGRPIEIERPRVAAAGGAGGVIDWEARLAEHRARQSSDGGGS